MFQFETSEWSLQLEDGTVVNLLDSPGAKDPFTQTPMEADVHAKQAEA